jgi:hypothetical protein
MKKWALTIIVGISIGILAWFFVVTMCAVWGNALT